MSAAVTGVRHSAVERVHQLADHELSQTHYETAGGGLGELLRIAAALLDAGHPALDGLDPFALARDLDALHNAEILLDDLDDPATPRSNLVRDGQ